LLITCYCYHEQIARKLNYSKEDKDDELVTGDDNKGEDSSDTGDKDNVMETPTSSKKGKRRIVYRDFDDDDDDDDNHNNNGDEDDDSDDSDDDDDDDDDDKKASVGMNNEDDDDKNDEADDKESGRMVVTPSSVNLNMCNLNVAPDESVSLSYTGDGMMDGFDPRTFQNIQQRNSGNYRDELIVKDFVKKFFFPHVS